jgi:hypothetical protein
MRGTQNIAFFTSLKVYFSEKFPISGNKCRANEGPFVTVHRQIPEKSWKISDRFVFDRSLQRQRSEFDFGALWKRRPHSEMSETPNSASVPTEFDDDRPHRRTTAEKSTTLKAALLAKRHQ